MPTRDTKRGYEPLATDDEKKTIVRGDGAETAEKAEKSERKPPLEVQITRVRSAPGRAMLSQVEGDLPAEPGDVVVVSVEHLS